MVSRGARAPRGRSAPRCSFCSQPLEDVAVLLYGPGVTICDSCVRECVELLEEGPPPVPRPR